MPGESCPLSLKIVVRISSHKPDMIACLEPHHHRNDTAMVVPHISLVPHEVVPVHQKEGAHFLCGLQVLEGSCDLVDCCYRGDELAVVHVGSVSDVATADVNDDVIKRHDGSRCSLKVSRRFYKKQHFWEKKWKRSAVKLVWLKSSQPSLRGKCTQCGMIFKVIVSRMHHIRFLVDVEYFWWLVGVTLLVAFGFSSQNFGDLMGTYEWGFYSKMIAALVVGTIIASGDTDTLLSVKNYFNFRHLCSGDAKLTGTSLNGWTLVPSTSAHYGPPDENFTTLYFILIEWHFTFSSLKDLST